jgi:hypothetical protein
VTVKVSMRIKAAADQREDILAAQFWDIVSHWQISEWDDGEWRVTDIQANFLPRAVEQLAALGVTAIVWRHPHGEAGDLHLIIDGEEHGPFPCDEKGVEVLDIADVRRAATSSDLDSAIEVLTHADLRARINAAHGTWLEFDADDWA